MYSELGQELGNKEKFFAKLGVLCVVAMLVIPAVVKWRLREPYPALLQPDFAAAPKIGKYTKADIRAIFNDGTSARITLNQLLSEFPHSHRWAVLPRIFGTEKLPERLAGLEKQRESELRGWTSKRMARLFPDKHTTRVDFFWKTLAWDVSKQLPKGVALSEKIRSVTLEETQPGARALALR